MHFQEKGTVASDVVAKMKEKQSRDESVSGGGFAGILCHCMLF